MIKKSCFFLLVLSISLTACRKSDNSSPNLLPKEIRELVYSKGNPNAPIVLVNTQGGPETELAKAEFDEIIQGVNTDNLLAVNVHQIQTLHPELFVSSDITFNDAERFNSESINLLFKVVKYFRDQNRTVYLMGISYGAFVVQEFIAKKGLNAANGYLIEVGRLDMNEEYWKNFKEGKGGFYRNGTIPVLDNNKAETAQLRNMYRLAAALAQNRYTHLLNRYDNLSAITYVYGKQDEAVGRLTQSEIDFLQSRNAEIIVGEGNHSETIDGYTRQALENAFGIK